MLSEEKVLELAKEAEIPIGITGGNPSKEKMQRFATLIQQAAAPASGESMAAAQIETIGDTGAAYYG